MRAVNPVAAVREGQGQLTVLGGRKRKMATECGSSCFMFLTFHSEISGSAIVTYIFLSFLPQFSRFFF